MRSGVPVPARRTPAGAATAAANFQIAGFRVASGTLEPDAAADVLLTTDAESSARSVLAAPTAADEQLRQERTTYAPLSVVVTEWSAARATVMVWGVSVTSSRRVPQPTGAMTWGRSTMTLIWSGAQWRIQRLEYDRGPWPARSDARLAEADGDFAFRFDELTQHGWSHVPEP